MSLHVIVGSGPVGSAVAGLLAKRGEQVRLVSLPGNGPDDPAIERVAADAANAARLSELTQGATVLYNCASPHYHRWPADWPPLAASMLHAAESSGAVLAMLSNLFGYGAVSAPMTEQTRLNPNTIKGSIRARMWHDALSAHNAGRIRVTEARASDYLGAGVRSILTRLIIPRVLAGQRLSVPADLDAPHSWTYVGDVARTLVTLGGDERAWGKPWIVPSPPPASVRDIVTRVAAIAEVPAPQLSRMSRLGLWLRGLTNERAREFRELAYQFERPFVVDSSAVTTTFGIQPISFDDALRETVQGVRRG